MKPDYDTLTFTSQADWHDWLDANHTIVDGLWVRMYKKSSAMPSVTYAEALDEALCYGWIDGLRRIYDEQSFIQKFTPRRKSSLWSKRNIEFTERLIADGRMQPAGQAEIDRAKADGRWDAAYDRQRDMVVPQDFLNELENHPVAKEFYATLNKSDRFAIAWRLQTATTAETRLRRMTKIIVTLDGKQPIR